MEANFFHGSIIGDREVQQDQRTNLVLPGGQMLYVLADGMGGHRAGEVASDSVCRAFREFFQSHAAGQEDPRDLLRQALAHANAALGSLLRTHPELDGMGTTVVAVLMDESRNAFSFISVGDSPLYCLRQGRLVRVNANHACWEYLQEQVRAGAMTAAQAAEHPDRHAVTSAVTGGKVEEVDQGSGELGPDELLLMASDGIHTLQDRDIEAILRDQGQNQEQAVTALLTAVAACKAPHQDNTTLLLIRPASLVRQADAEDSPPDPPPAGRHARPAKPSALLLGALVLLVLLAGIGFGWWLFRSPPDPVVLPVSQEHNTPVRAEEQGL